MTTPILFKEYIWLVETIHKAGKITLAELNKQDDQEKSWFGEIFYESHRALPHVVLLFD
jgi:hypothetical protein